MKISTKSQYGLRAMIYLAKNKDRICSLKEISKKEKISFDYLEKIFLKLEKAGLVRSKKGSLGGYYLAKNPEKIKIGKIISALEKNIFLVKCLDEICPQQSKCLAKNFWKKLNDNINKTLNSITLANLLKK